MSGDESGSQPGATTDRDPSRDGSAPRDRGLLAYLGLAFVYPALAAVAVQFWLLPYVFPKWHWGHGLLRGGDWIEFHRVAVATATRMQIVGWSAWTLRPDGAAPAGIAAALYHLFTPEPWVLIPINAAVHAVSVLFLVLILESFCGDRRLAILASLPFLFFPTSMLWTTQLHKDGWMALGSLALIYGWIRLVRTPDPDDGEGEGWKLPSFGELTAALSLVFLGGLCVWVVRPYFVRVFVPISTVVSAYLTAILFRRARGRGSEGAGPEEDADSEDRRSADRRSGDRGNGISEDPGRRRRWRESPVAVVAGVLLVAWASTAIVLTLNYDPTDKLAGKMKFLSNEWSYTPYVPWFIDEQFRMLAEVRAEYLSVYAAAGSNVDREVELGDAADVVAYMPRAAQVGLFAPFPTRWLAEGSSSETTVMRRVAALEVAWFYLSFVVLVPLVYRWRRRPELWIVLAFTVPVIVVQSLSVPNIGTLHRVRFGYWVLLGSLGFLEILRRAGAVDRLGWGNAE